MNCKYFLALFLIQLINCNEHLYTVVNKGESLYMNEHIFNHMGQQIIVEGLNMKEDDKFRVVLTKFGVHQDDYKDTLNQTHKRQKEIKFTSSNLNRIFSKNAIAQNEQGEHLQLQISNIGKNNIKFKIIMKSFITPAYKNFGDDFDDYDTKPKKKQFKKVEEKQSDKFVEKGKVKYQVLDYIQNLVFHIKKIAQQIKKHEKEKLIVSQSEVNEFREFSQSVKVIGSISILGFIVLSLTLMCGMSQFIRKKKNV